MNIDQFEHLRSEKMITFKEESVCGRTFTIISYMVTNPDLWKLENALECRGITFDSHGNCVCRPFEKFFSLGENETVQPKQVFGREVEIYDKIDGSMITPVLIDAQNEQMLMKSKKSFFSDVAISASELLNSSRKLQEFCLRWLVCGYTPIFEFTSNQNKIVIDYGDEPKLTLLAIRHNLTGAYVEYDDLSKSAKKYEVEITKRRVGSSLEQISGEMSTLTGIEGYVAVLTDGRRVKVKTEWYRKLHRINTDLRERDIAEAIVDELIDDIKMVCSEHNISLEKIENIERRVSRELSEIKCVVDAAVSLFEAQKLSFKDAAALFKDTQEFSLIMYSIRGSTPDFIKFWKKHYLKDYSLTVVFNHNFSNKEVN